MFKKLLNLVNERVIDLLVAALGPLPNLIWSNLKSLFLNVFSDEITGLL